MAKKGRQPVVGVVSKSSRGSRAPQGSGAPGARRGSEQPSLAEVTSQMQCVVSEMRAGMADLRVSMSELKSAVVTVSDTLTTLMSAVSVESHDSAVDAHIERRSAVEDFYETSAKTFGFSVVDRVE